MANRIWIYQSIRPLTDVEVEKVTKEANDFTQSWVSHATPLTANARVLHERFLILSVDETAYKASGCSIDKSLRFVVALADKIGTDFLNRLNFSYFDSNNELQMADSESFKALYKKKEINDNTIVFDTLLSKDTDFDTLFAIKLGDSWHKRMVK